MPVHPCHIGVAFYNFPGFPPQWVLVLSENRRFEGKVWCNSAIETVEGWCRSSKKCNPSLASFDPTAMLSGVVHIGNSWMPMKKLRGWVSRYKLPSGEEHSFVHDSNVPARYAIGILLHLCQIRSLRLPTLDAVMLTDMIGDRASMLQKSQSSVVDNRFPVARLMKRGTIFGRFLS
jgi:hypothetical protein